MIKATFSPSDENKVNETVHSTSIEGLYYIPHKFFPDNRGFYAELARVPEIEELIGKQFVTKQMNQSRSIQNVTRGIHAEDWNKLITITNGLCYCALVDLRQDSPTFGNYESFYLGTEEQALKGSLFVSSGIGNSLCVVKGPVDYIYAVDAIWSDRNIEGDQAIAIFDNDINIQWPIDKEQMIISDRDRNSKTLRELYPNKF